MSVITTVSASLDPARWRANGGRQAMVAGLRLLPAPLAAVAAAAVAELALWPTALLALLSTTIVLLAFRARAMGHRFGLANGVTLLRLNLAAFLLAAVLAVLWSARGADGWLLWVVFAVAAAALTLDGVDGWLARRRREASAFGERFDMGVDTAFTIVTTLCLVTFGLVGAWVLLLGLMRPAFAAAAHIWPVLAAPLPDSRGRKIACAGSLACLVGGLAPPLAALAPALALAATGQLLWSFGRDIGYLFGHNATAAPVDRA